MPKIAGVQAEFRVTRKSAGRGHCRATASGGVTVAFGIYHRAGLLRVGKASDRLGIVRIDQIALTEEGMRARWRARRETTRSQGRGLVRPPLMRAFTTSLLGAGLQWRHNDSGVADF